MFLSEEPGISFSSPSTIIVFALIFSAAIFIVSSTLGTSTILGIGAFNWIFCFFSSGTFATISSSSIEKFSSIKKMSFFEFS